MHSVSDLTTFARKTKGDVPPPLVGASTTVLGSKMYLFGGRLVSLRKMVSDMYIFDLQTFIWTKVEPKPDDPVPGPRYFHSADAWDDHLVIFGGMGYADPSSEDLCVLSDVRLFSLSTLSWLPVAPVQTASDDPANPVPTPRARYAHLSSVTASKLFIIGGQDLSNVWLDDIHVYDLPTATWVMWRAYPRHCGTYRSVAVCAARRVRSPMDELKAGNGSGSPPPQGYQFLGPVGARFASGSNVVRAGNTAAIDTAPDGPTPTKELVHLPYSCEPTDEFPNDIYLYSNYNFTDVKRELEVIGPLPSDFTITDRSGSMSGSALPPGLRFPTGAILGQHLVIAGTYLAHSYQSFSIWALDLVNMTWSRIDPGATLASGSWSRGVLWERGNRFLIFGNREGNLVEDYNRRLLSWDHVAYIDLEAFGIYQPPELTLSLAAQEMGLAALEEGVCADFEVACEDGRRIACSRRLLEERWEWFRDKRRDFQDNVNHVLNGMGSAIRVRGDVALPDLPGVLVEGDREAGGRPDPRLTARALQLSEPYPITLAFLQWIYTQGLITRLQHAPAVLSALLLLGTTYGLKELEIQVKHAMHRALTHTTSVGVYEVATLCDCQSLQIRALKVVMSSSKQRSSARARPPGGPGGPGTDDGGARPRGMSDAPNRPTRPSDGPSMRSTYGSAPAPSSVLSASTNGYSRQAVAGLHLTVPHPQEYYESDMSNTFAVTTPYSDGVGAGYYETHGALEFSPNSVVDPNAPTSLPPGQQLQQRRQTFDTLPQWPAVPRGVRSASASARISTGGPNGNSLPLAARPGIQASQASKHIPQLHPEKHQIDKVDFDEMLGIDDSDAEARMKRLLNSLESVTQPDRQNIHEGDWVPSPPTRYSQSAPPPSYENAQRPSVLNRGALARPLEVSATPLSPAPLYENERVHPRGGGAMDYYTEAESRLPASAETMQFPYPPQHITARSSPLPRYKSAPSMPNTIAMSPPPPRNPLRSSATITDANYTAVRKPTLHRGRYGGSEQNLYDLSKQTSRPAQPGYGQFNSCGNLLLNPPITPASPGSMLPGLISDSVSRSSSFGSIHTRLVTPTDSTTPVLSGAPHASLGRIDEKSSLDYNEIEATNEHQMVREVREREKAIEKTLALKWATPLAPSSWQPPVSAELSSANHVHSAIATPATSVFEGGSTVGGLSISGGSGSSSSSSGPGGLGGLQRSFSRSGASEISTYTDILSRTSAGGAPIREQMSPSVLAATSFAMNGTIPTGVALSKAEKAAEKALQKADKAAKKAEAARLKVEQEREAKAQQEESKRVSADSKRHVVDAKKREKEERQRQAELNVPRLMLFST